MQRFNIDNVETRYIKSLLLNTYLPNFPIACEGDFIVADCYYVYGDFVIRCLTSGILLNNSNVYYDNIKYVRGYNSDKTPFRYLSPSASDFVICRSDLLCGVGVRTATYDVICSFNHEKPLSGVTSNYISHSNVYDDELHQQLGRYLRWYKSSYKIDLMPLYNCFINNDITQFHLTNSGIKNGSNTNYITWIVPALLNKSYQIFINSPSTVMIKGAFINRFGRVQYHNDGESDYLDKLLEDKVYVYNDTSYSNPLTYRAFTSNRRLIEYSNDFYIVIQVPNTHSGSITVIEGESIRYNHNIITSGEIYMNRSDDKWSNIDYSNFNPTIKSSIAMIAGKHQVPYSDRLIEYLVGSVIHRVEDIPQNITRLQKSIGIDKKYNLEKDVWDDFIKYKLYNKYHTFTDNRYVKSIHPDDNELSHIPDSKKVYPNDPNVPQVVMGLKNMRNRMSNSIKSDILGFCDKDIENSIYRYKEV
jgi:hypothetical protein